MIDWQFSGATAHNPAALTDGIRINTASKEALLADVKARFLAGKGFTIATLNLDHIVKMRQSDQFKTAYSSHSHVVADGNPIVWLSRLARRPVDLAPGSELIDPLVALAAEMNMPIGMLGSTEETLAATSVALKAKYPGLVVAAEIAPAHGFDPHGDEATACLEKLKASGARICFLALGAPKQEVLAARATEMLPDCGFVSIGAGLDFIAGSQTRAPKWVRAVAMEWVWRLLSNPKRLGKRYWDCIVILPGLALEALRARRSGTATSGAVN
jgi:exopolysaccharide biosynthesis WecB/TagA/CpsF family protein